MKRLLIGVRVNGTGMVLVAVSGLLISAIVLWLDRHQFKHSPYLGLAGIS